MVVVVVLCYAILCYLMLCIFTRSNIDNIGDRDKLYSIVNPHSCKHIHPYHIDNIKMTQRWSRGDLPLCLLLNVETSQIIIMQLIAR